MDYRDSILHTISQAECSRISRKVIRRLQRMTEDMQSGADTPLKNIWDEICVQVQSQESVFWDAYLDLAQRIVWDEVSKLPPAVKQAIWLQTNEGADWEPDYDGGGEAPPVCDDDVLDYVLHDFVLTAAADWTNSRITKYLEAERSFDD